MKIVLNLIGCVAVALGVLGIFLPLLPTTPFLLLASACFARGSTRLHNWLQTNRVFGKYLRDYENGKGIPLRGKVWILIFMWASMSYSIWRIEMPLIGIMIAMIGLGVTIYLTRFVPTMSPLAGAELPGLGKGVAVDDARERDGIDGVRFHPRDGHDG
ncbi:MAG TPA: YbaN family protein [Duganella sp.]|nr:YbaN family protein [Duganella sp.]